MLKAILLGGAMMMSAPVLAQNAQPVAPAQDTVPAELTDVAPAPSANPQPQSAPAATAQATQSAPAESAAATPAQIAQIVDEEFPKYDKDSTGELDQAQFGEWMLALRSASEPGLTAENAELKTWVANAFASADKDQSKAVSKAELTSFLSQGA